MERERVAPSAKFGRLPPLATAGGGGMGAMGGIGAIGAITGYCIGGANEGCNVTGNCCEPNLLNCVNKNAYNLCVLHK
jgi:hypothetical protein